MFPSDETHAATHVPDYCYSINILYFCNSVPSYPSLCSARSSALSKSCSINTSFLATYSNRSSQCNKQHKHAQKVQQNIVVLVLHPHSISTKRRVNNILLSLHFCDTIIILKLLVLCFLKLTFFI